MKMLLFSPLVALLLTGCDLPRTTAETETKAVAPAAADSGNPTNAAPATVPPLLPPNLPDAARDVVNLAHTQVGDGVLTNFIASLKEPFHLDADQIVYLRDLGISPAVIEALLVRQQQLDTANPDRPAPARTSAGTVPVEAEPPGPFSEAPTNTPTLYPGATPSLAQPQVGPAETVATEPQPVVNNYNYFYDSLAPYGSWITVPSYGYVWQPSCAVVTPGWRPYWNNGGWLWSDCGWYWNSYYSWGWAPFHYGNWVTAPGHGWCWAPGNTWGPSWVTFRYSSGYCGWAPLPPGCGWQSGVGLTWAGAGVGVNFSFGYGAGNYCWTPTSYFTAANCWNHGVTGPHTSQIYQNSSVINNYIVGNNNTIINGGIDPGQIQKVTRSEVRKVQLADVHSPSAASGLAAATVRPGQNGRVPVYRPAVTPGAAPTGTTVGSPRVEARPTQLAANSGNAPSRFHLPARPTPPADTVQNAPARVTLPAGSPNPRGSTVQLHGSSPPTPSSSASSIPARGNGSGSPTVIPSRGAQVSSPRQALPSYTGQPSPTTGVPSRQEPRKVVTPSPATPGYSPAQAGNPSSARLNPAGARGNVRPAPVAAMPARTPGPAYQAPAYSRPQGAPATVTSSPRVSSSPGPSYNPAPRGQYSGGSSGNSGSLGRPGARPAP